MRAIGSALISSACLAFLLGFAFSAVADESGGVSRHFGGMAKNFYLGLEGFRILLLLITATEIPTRMSSSRGIGPRRLVTRVSAQPALGAMRASTAGPAGSPWVMANFSVTAGTWDWR